MCTTLQGWGGCPSDSAAVHVRKMTRPYEAYDSLSRNVVWMCLTVTLQNTLTTQTCQPHGKHKGFKLTPQRKVAKQPIIV